MKAFPTTKPLDSWGDPNAGMDLRDYFAAKAIPSLVKTFENYVTTPDDVAKLAYQYADAMMKARESK
jgi:hypothetical protein